MVQQRKQQFPNSLQSFFARIPLWVWLVLCLVVAGVYTVVALGAPAPTNSPDLSYIVLRWFHPLVWLLLAISVGIRMTQLPGKKRLAKSVALVALFIYAIFMLEMVTHLSS